MYRTILIAYILNIPQGRSNELRQYNERQVKPQSLYFHPVLVALAWIVEQQYTLERVRGGPFIPSRHLVTWIETHAPPITVQARTLTGISFIELSKGCRCAK